MNKAIQRLALVMVCGCVGAACAIVVIGAGRIVVALYYWVQ